MPQFETDHDVPKVGQISRKLRVEWSKRRAWHGEHVAIHVRSENIEDGLAVELTIQGTDGTEVAKINAGTLAGNKLDHDYTIDWKAKVLPAGLTRFVVVAATKAPDLTSPESLGLEVDLAPPIFSA